MLVKMSYGKHGLNVDIPEKNLAGILRMKKPKVLEKPIQAVKSALKNPISSKPLEFIARGKKDACIVISDITRPVPNKIILPPILDVLANIGVKATILIATGIHRPNAGKELDEMLGHDIANKYPIVNHVSRDIKTHKYLGLTSQKVPIYVDKTYLDADLKILTGLIEPHLMAGYSGGRKSICPGICSVETMKVMHGPHILENENASTGILEGNPFHEGALEIAHIAGVDFILNVVLNEEREIVGVFAGDIVKAHEEGVKCADQIAKVQVNEPADIVLVSNAGYPLDTTFYQAIKGMVTAMAVVKNGGSIILVSECSEGLGGPEFTELVMGTKDLDSFMEKLYDPNYFVIDQWMLEEMAKVVKKAKVYCYCPKIEDNILSRLSIKPVSSPENGLKSALEEHGADAKILVIPEGPYVLAKTS